MAKATITTTLARSPPLPTGSQRKLRVFDDRLTGFFLEVWPSGAVVFWVRYNDERNRTREVKVGKFGDLTVEQARKKAQEIRGQVALGGDPGAERGKRRAVPTFDEFVTKRYLSYVKDRLRSYRDQESFCRLRLLPRWGSRRLDEIKPTDIVALQSDLRAEGLANATVNRYTVLVRRIFNVALRWEVVDLRNPAKHAEMLREQGREKFLAPAEVRRLFQALDAETSKSAAACIALLALTGARKSEALAMRWGDVDLDRRTWRVARSKSGRTRHIPLSDAAVATLMTRPRIEDCPWVFPAFDPAHHLEGLRKCWDRVKKLAGLDAALRIHDLRHSFASTLVNNGRPLFEVAQILGHSQLATTQRYSHFENGRLVDAANIAGRLSLPAVVEA